MNNADIVEQLERMCGRVVSLKNGWNSFVYHHQKFVNIPDPHRNTIKFAIPFLTKIGNYKKEILEQAINETNRDVMFVKLIFQKNGNVTMRYDYKLFGNAVASDIVPHMIETLYKASERFMLRLQLQ